MAEKSTKYQAIVALGAKMDQTFGPTLSKANKLVSGFGKSLAFAGKTAAVGFGFLGVGAAAAGAAAIKLGSTVVQQFGELEQNLGGAEAVFGQFADRIQKTGEQAYKNLGVSQSDYLATANKMGALFQGSGVEQEKSLELTEKAMQRAADMASVMGIDMQAALDSVAGAAKGNFTMMDNLGVAMNATTIEAYAMSKGLNFAWKSATQAQKAEVAMQMFFENTEQYAGNFARESTETITGSIGLLKAAMSSFTAGLGNANADMVSLSGNVVDAFGAVVSNVVPIMKNIASALPLALEGIAPAIGDMLPILLDTVAELGAGLINMGVKMLPKLIPLAVDGVKTIAKSVVKNIPLLAKAGAEMGETLFSSLVDAAPWMKPMLSSIKGLLAPAINLGKTIFSTVIGVFKEMAGAASPIIEKLAILAKKFIELANVVLPIFGPAFSAVFSAILDAALPAVAGITTALGGLMDFITGVFTSDWQQAWDGVKSVFGGVADSLAQLWKAPMNVIIGSVNRLFGGLGEIKIPDWVPLLGGKSMKFPQIPMLAKGTPYFQGGAAIVGERGPELVNLPRGSAVHPSRETKSILSAPQSWGGGIGSITLQIVQHFSGSYTREQMKEQMAEAARMAEVEFEKMMERVKAKRRRTAFQG